MNYTSPCFTARAFLYAIIPRKHNPFDKMLLAELSEIRLNKIKKTIKHHHLRNCYSKHCALSYKPRFSKKIIRLLGAPKTLIWKIDLTDFGKEWQTKNITPIGEAPTNRSVLPPTKWSVDLRRDGRYNLRPNGRTRKIIKDRLKIVCEPSRNWDFESCELSALSELSELSESR